MNNKTFRNHISQQCGFTPNKAKQGVGSHGGKAIRGWADADHILKTYKAEQVCNAGDWPTVEDQQRYWQERDEHLDRTESNAQWIDNKAKNEGSPFA